MYNQPMKGNPGLTELEVAEIATYIYNSWGNVHDRVEVAEASSILAACPDR
jgi:cytochrome c551